MSMCRRSTPRGWPSSVLTSGQAIVIDESIADSATNQEVACAFALAQLKAIYLLSSFGR